MLEEIKVETSGKNAETDTGKKIDAKADTINVNAFKQKKLKPVN